MQSTTRKFNRILEGRQNDVPSSTKIAKTTEAPKQLTKGPGYRTNRFVSKTVYKPDNTIVKGNTMPS